MTALKCSESTQRSFEKKGTAAPGREYALIQSQGQVFERQLSNE